MKLEHFPKSLAAAATLISVLLGQARGESASCAASCSGNQPQWSRPSDGVVTPRATNIAAWSYDANMSASQWMLFPYNKAKQSALSTSTAGQVLTPKAFEQHYYVWSRETLPDISPILSGVDLWYTLSFKCKQSSSNRVRG
jgi:hypothetical protein